MAGTSQEVEARSAGPGADVDVVALVTKWMAEDGYRRAHCGVLIGIWSDTRRPGTKTGCRSDPLRGDEVQRPRLVVRASAPVFLTDS
jgi:hypothetical protein